MEARLLEARRSLRRRRLKGEGKGVLGARETRGALLLSSPRGHVISFIYLLHNIRKSGKYIYVDT